MALVSTPDVLVVGAGIIGASAAWRLAQHGMRVVIIDSGTFGGESSRAGAGMLAPGGEFAENSRWAYWAVESRRLYPAFVEELEQESGSRIDLRTCGALELTRGEDEWAALTRRAKVQSALSIRSEPLPREEVLRLAPALQPGSFDHALLYPDDAIVDPVDVTRALRAALVCRNVQIVEHTAVEHVDPATGVVEAGQSRYAAGRILVAAGAWSSALLSMPVPESVPVKGHLVGYQTEPGFLDPVIRRGHCYLLQRSNGFLIAGATTEPAAGFDRSVQTDTADRLHDEASEYVPALRQHRPDLAWVGFRPGAVDPSGNVSKEPVVERLILKNGEESQTWIAYGHYRNGILLAPVTAKLLAGLIVMDSAVLTKPKARA